MSCPRIGVLAVDDSEVPGEAVTLGGAMGVSPPAEIAAALDALFPSHFP